METETQVEETALDDNAMVDESATDETTHDDGAQDEQEVETETEETPAEPKPWELKRINKITYQREEARREAAAQKTRADELEAALKKAQEAAPTSVGKPKIEDFDSDEEFYDSLTDWKLDQRDLKTKTQTEAERQKTAQQTAAEAYNATRESVNANGMKKYKDYKDVVFTMPADILNQEMAAALFETDAPEDIAYHLGKNLEEAARISKLPPIKKAIALGKISARLTTKSTTNAPPDYPAEG